MLTLAFLPLGARRAGFGGYVEPMLVEEIEANGLRGFSGPRKMRRLERASLPWEEGRALRDALQLAFALVDPVVLRTLLEGWGASELEVSEEPLLVSVRYSGAPGLESLLEPDAGGVVRVRVRLRLDPPQFATLRHHAVRDVRLVDALAGGPTCELAVGALLRPGSLTLDLRSFLVGSVPFAVSGPDRPGWLGAFLLGLRGRLAAAPLAPAAWGEAARSWSADRQGHLRAALVALAASPAAVSGLVALPEEPALLEAGRLLPLRFAGPRVRAAVGWVGAVQLGRPDVLVAMHAPAGEGWPAWWEGQLDAAEAAVEQVILLDEAPVG